METTKIYVIDMLMYDDPEMLYGGDWWNSLFSFHAEDQKDADDKAHRWVHLHYKSDPPRVRCRPLDKNHPWHVQNSDAIHDEYIPDR